MYRRAFSSVCFCALALGLMGCISVDLRDVVSPSLEEHEISRDSAFTRDKILIVDISGHIRSGSRGLFSRTTTPRSVKAILNKAAKDGRIRAVVLRINSPGGEVTATDIVHHHILAFKEETGIPVYASIMSLGTSGGYYVAATADEIYSHPTSVVGSIGVIARVPQLAELADKIGYSEVVLKSAKNKDLGDPLRKMTEEQRAILQNTIDSLHERFLDVVVASRAGYHTKDELRPIADGRTYTPAEALSVELVDGIAYLDEVIDKAKASAGVKNARIVTYNHTAGHDSNIYSKLPTQLNLFNVDMRSLFGDGLPGFHFLWMPGN